MRIVRTLEEMLAISGGAGFVPTMGALHEGHLSLIRAAAEENAQVVVSLFVNPTQFGEGEDFEKYPRTESQDAELAASAGATVFFAPQTLAVYPRKTTWVNVDVVTDLWEGSHRPGHFRGVATVVAKLFHLVRPARAYFGLKDFQQCKVIQRMVEDLNMPLELRFMETVREDDGLALSSRNRYLSPQERARAPELYRQLNRAQNAILGGADVEAELSASRQELEEVGFLVDYFALVDTTDLRPIPIPLEDARLISAARLGSTRLIDNIALRP